MAGNADKIAELEEKLRVLAIQNNARGVLLAGYDAQGLDRRAEHLARAQLDSQREANARLTDEVEQLQARLTAAEAARDEWGRAAKVYAGQRRHDLARLTAAEAARDAAVAERDEVRSYAREVGAALVGLTCDGSEFYRRAGEDWRVDPAACVAYVRRQRADKHDSILRFAKQARDAEAQRDAALARAERLEQALKPFAEAADNLDGDEHDSRHLWESPEAMMLTAGDLRAARAAIASPAGDQQ